MVGLCFAFELSYEGVWEFLLLYPITIVPFTYFTSLYFRRDTIAQIFTLFLHFLMGGIMPMVWDALRKSSSDSTKDVANKLRWILTVFPTFSIG